MTRLHRLFRRDAGIALLLVIVGLGVAERGWAYSIGSMGNIGPGFFPFGLGLLLAVLGTLQLAAELARGGEDASGGKFPWRPTIMISLAMAVWVLMLSRYGLIPATVALVIIASLSEAPFRIFTVISSAIVLSLACYGLFVYILQMPLAAFVW